MLERIFHLSAHGTTVRTELLAGLTTFLTMAYIIFVQPAVLSGRMFDIQTGIDFGAVTTATCLSAALATAIMALVARYPIAQAPGMGENFFFVFSLLPAAGAVAGAGSSAWQIGFGVIFLSGLLFLALSLVGVRELLLDAVSPSLRSGIAAGIGLFVAFIGLQNATLVLKDPGTGVKINPHFASPDLIVFFVGLLLTAGLHARRVRGAILWGILAATLLSIGLKMALPRFVPNAPPPAGPSAADDAVPGTKNASRTAEKQGAAGLVAQSMLVQKFTIARGVVSRPPSLAPTFGKMDLAGALSWPMVPFILIFLFMNLFDTLGTLIGVSQQAGLVRDGRLPRLKQALVSDAVGTVFGAACGTSTVVSFVESAAGVAQGGRTGLTALAVSVLFLAALFFSPIIAMVGSYPPITAPALVLVGSMMIRCAAGVEWSNEAEAIPAFLVMVGIPLTYSIADGLALGFISYPVVKLLAGQGRQVKWLSYAMALVLVAYFLAIRGRTG
jgi:AGZA family xanthine/uracil permease-like MFS transporter